MLAFEITVNGQRRILAGFHDWDTLHFDLLAIREGFDEELNLRLRLAGGAQPKEEGVRESVRWKTPPVTIGDEVTVRIVDVSEADSPTKRYRSDKTVQENPFTDEEIEEMQRQDYERLRKKYEPYS